MKSKTYYVLLSAILMALFSIQAWGFNDEHTMEVIKKSKETRSNLEKTLPTRDLASLKTQEKNLNDEYQQLMNQNEDNNWFNEVDKVIAED